MPFSSLLPGASVVRPAALTLLLNLVVPELLALILPRAWLLPTAPVIVILPVPASRVKSRSLALPALSVVEVLTVPLKSILPLPEPVLKLALFPRVVSPLMAIFWFSVVIVAFRVVSPIRVIDVSPVPVIFPFTAIEPSGDRTVVGSKKVTPALSIEIAPLPSARPIVTEAKPSAKALKSSDVRSRVPVPISLLPPMAISALRVSGSIWSIPELLISEAPAISISSPLKFTLPVAVPEGLIELSVSSMPIIPLPVRVISPLVVDSIMPPFEARMPRVLDPVPPAVPVTRIAPLSEITEPESISTPSLLSVPEPPFPVIDILPVSVLREVPEITLTPSLPVPLPFPPVPLRVISAPERAEILVSPNNIPRLLAVPAPPVPSRAISPPLDSIVLVDKTAIPSFPSPVPELVPVMAIAPLPARTELAFIATPSLLSVPEPPFPVIDIAPVSVSRAVPEITLTPSLPVPLPFPPFPLRVISAPERAEILVSPNNMPRLLAVPSLPVPVKVISPPPLDSIVLVDRATIPWLPSPVPALVPVIDIAPPERAEILVSRNNIPRLLEVPALPVPSRVISPPPLDSIVLVDKTAIPSFLSPVPALVPVMAIAPLPARTELAFISTPSLSLVPEPPFPVIDIAPISVSRAVPEITLTPSFPVPLPFPPVPLRIISPPDRAEILVPCNNIPWLLVVPAPPVPLKVIPPPPVDSIVLVDNTAIPSLPSPVPALVPVMAIAPLPARTELAFISTPSLLLVPEPPFPVIDIPPVSVSRAVPEIILTPSLPVPLPFPPVPLRIISPPDRA